MPTLLPAVSLRLLIAIAALCSPLGCGFATTPSRTAATALSNTQLVDRVLNDYYNAIGGYDHLKAIHTRHMRGEYTEGSFHGVTEIFQERPQLRRVNLFTSRWDHIEGFDGQTWEYHRDAGQAKGRLTRDTIGGPAELAQRRGSEFDESFVDYRARGFAAELLGQGRLGDIDVIQISIERTDNWTVDYYFDLHSHLLVAIGKAMPLHAEGPKIESLTFFSDWRFVSGLLIPFSGEERDARTGAIMNTLSWDSIELNVPIARRDILPPSPD